MTDMSMALNELLEKREASSDFLRDTLTFLLQAINAMVTIYTLWLIRV